MDQDLNLLLLDAASRGDAEAVKQCIEQGANPDARDAHSGWTALHLAAAAGHSRVVQALVERYADREAQTPSGNTPLQLAFDYRHWFAFFHLLALGARIWGLDLECRQRLIEMFCPAPALGSPETGGLFTHLGDVRAVLEALRLECALKPGEGRPMGF